MVPVLVLARGDATPAAPLDDAGGMAVARFQPVAGPPPVLQGRIPGSVRSLQFAGSAQAAFYAATDETGKARVWLLRNNALVAEITAPGSRPHMNADWQGSFTFWLGNVPVVAISWKFGQDNYGIEDMAFWAAEGPGRYLGGLPGSTRSPCGPGEAPGRQECSRCPSANGIPIDVKLTSLQADRARFVQLRAANWYYYYGASAETFEQDYLLTANGLAPDGQARRSRRTMSIAQAKERVKVLLRDYFKLAKTHSRPEIAPEFLACFEQLADLSPDFGQAHYNVGCMQALLGNHKEAVASVIKAISLDPKYYKVARRDPDLASVRNDPDLVQVIGR
jgi:hypothetical protein